MGRGVGSDKIDFAFQNGKNGFSEKRVFRVTKGEGIEMNFVSPLSLSLNV